MSRPLESGAYRKLRSSSRGNGERRVAVSDFSGLVSSACALASAAAMAPMVSLERCIGPLPLDHIEAHRAGLRALGANAVSERLLGVPGHQALEFRLGLLVLDEGVPGAPEHGCKLGPSIRAAHVDDADRRQARPRRLD